MERAPRRAERAAFVALAVSGLLLIAKLLVWRGTGSLAVLSQAIDSALDVVVMALMFVGVRIAAKPADYNHHYGHAKAENLVAFVQTLVLGGIVVGIAVEAVQRLLGVKAAEPEVTWYALALFATTVVLDAVRVVYLTATARREGSAALRAGAVNFAGDIGTALVTLLSLVAVRAGVAVADPIGALVVAAAVGIAAVGIGRRSVAVLMDTAPDPQVISAVEEAIAAVPGVAETRRVRLRGEHGNLFGDVTVAADLTASLQASHDIARNVRNAVAAKVPGADVTVHVEPADEPTRLIDRIRTAASRPHGVFEVHNIRAHRLWVDGERLLHVTLHAKVPADVPLRDAHERSAQIAAEVRAELGEDVRVDAHMEPLEVTEVGVDVTQRRRDIVQDVQDLAAAEPAVQRCHQVLVSDVDDELAVTLELSGYGDVPLARIHSASERIERLLRARHPEVGVITVHFVTEHDTAATFG